MTNITTTPVTFNFRGDSLMLVNFNEQPYIAMRNLVESIGLDWKSQFTKLKSSIRWGAVEIVAPIDGGQRRSLTCIPLRKLHGWLMTLHPRKVKPELCEKIIAYQNECDDALWDYWSKGVAVRKSYVANPDDVLTADQAEELRLTLKLNCDKLPKEKQAAFMIKGWAKLKSHFGVSYRKIPQREFTEAVSLLNRHVVEWELLDASNTVIIDQYVKSKIQSTISHFEFLVSWWNRFGDGIRVINPLAASCIHDNFIDGVICAREVGKEMDLRSVKSYAENYPWLADAHTKHAYYVNSL